MRRVSHARHPRIVTVSEEARTTPLELFFDLVFVFAFTQVTALMADDPTGRGLVRGLLVLAVVWWCWVGFAWLGWGALSFVLPPVLQAVYENVAGWRYVKQWPRLGPAAAREDYLRLFRETRWLRLSAAMLAPAALIGLGCAFALRRILATAEQRGARER